MHRQSFALTLATMVLSIGIATALLISAQVRKPGNPSKSGDNGPRGAAQGPQIAAGDYILSGPYAHNNLTIFLVHGKNLIAGDNFLTLQEALEQRKVIVYETKDVNELAIQNLSDKDVYVQSGDIVKGGQQDRMIGVDLIVPPRSGKIPIAAFCVEHGRWSGRGDEQATVFSSSADAAATKEIKLAAKQSNSQSGVWASVAVAQDKLSQNVGARVNSTVSESSLQLAVENRKVQETASAYVNALSGIMNGKQDVIGFVFAINGQINSADIYASHALFRKLWPKLLKASAVEAIAELDGNKQIGPETAENIKAFLADSGDGKIDEKEVTQRVKLITRENARHVFFETRDRKRNDGWVHRNYIKK